MNEATARAGAFPVAEYKRILQRVLENRPSGTRQRLATALGTNRSFVSQIANPAYTTPISNAASRFDFRALPFFARGPEGTFSTHTPAPTRTVRRAAMQR
jgi:hypothetical protein